MARKRVPKASKKVEKILELLDQTYPEAHCELEFRNPLQLLIATILSAQCTDRRVNMVTRQLFKKYKTAEDFARANLKRLQEEIRPTGFFRNKSKSIQAAGEMLIKEFGGEVPRSMDQLLKLPGVARKTANVVLGTAFGIAEGLVVDTHVRRVSQRLGLTENDNPQKIEQDLVKEVPRGRWISFSHQLIWHGRRVCHARKPLCHQCNLTSVCDYYRQVLDGR